MNHRKSATSICNGSVSVLLDNVFSGVGILRITDSGPKISNISLRFNPTKFGAVNYICSECGKVLEEKDIEVTCSGCGRPIPLVTEDGHPYAYVKKATVVHYCKDCIDDPDHNNIPAAYVDKENIAVSHLLSKPVDIEGFNNEY